MTAKLYSLKSYDAAAKLICGAPVYLVGISRSGRHVRWAADRSKALKVTATKRDRLREQYPVQMHGRWVRAV